MEHNCYIDTRGNVETPLSFTEALVKGLAQGGGLFVPQNLPSFGLDEIIALADLPYAQRAAKVYQAFDTDLDDETIERLMEATYGAAFDTEDICPITSLDEKT
ncbi:MAG: threonine synthase, partial [Eggerthellaceae bacterium]